MTGGLIWGATLFLTTIAYIVFGYGKAFLDIWVSIYPGYTLTAMGSVVGAIYGFVDMYVGVYIVYWVYKQLGASK